MKTYTLKQLQKKYMGKWIDASDVSFWNRKNDDVPEYKIRKVYDEIHENTRQVTENGFDY